MIRIGELSRKTSTSPELLRAWELRYGLLQPQRTAGGLRLYNDADIAKVRAMKRLIAAGIAPAQAAEQLLAGGEAGNDLPNDEAADPGAAIHRSNMLEAIDALDTTQVQRELDLVLARLSVGGALEQVVLPVMRALGVASSDALGIAQEHLFTNAVRGSLRRSRRRKPSPSRPDRGAAR